MKQHLQPGDIKKHSFKVLEEHYPDFGTSVVHPVCSTYVLAREIEWSTRLFMLDVIEHDEEGIGTMIEIQHKSPAYFNDQVEILATLKSIQEGVMICEFVVRVGDRVVAEGKTGQKLLKKSALSKIYRKGEIE